MSDSIAFLEAPMVEECRRSSAGGSHHHNAGHDFERFDDDQLMSMFNDDVVVGGPTMSCSNPSSPSDHNSINDDGPSDHLHQMQVQPKSEPEEDESSCKSEGFNSLHATTPEDPTDHKIVDPKRIKRYSFISYFNLHEIIIYMRNNYCLISEFWQTGNLHRGHE